MANQTEAKSWTERGLGEKPSHKPLTVGDELLWLVLVLHVAAWVWAVNLFCCTSPPPRIQNDGDLTFGFHKLHIPYHWRAPEPWEPLGWTPEAWPEVVEMPMPPHRPRVVKQATATSPYDRMPILRGDQ